MNRVLSREQELMDILKRGGYWMGNELSEEMGISRDNIGHIIKRMRKKFAEGDETISHYIYSSKNGYTIDERKEDIVYEHCMRIKMGSGIILNGSYVYGKCRELAFKEINNFMVEYKPKLSKVKKMIGLSRNRR